jgi:hypothetical protein
MKITEGYTGAAGEFGSKHFLLESLYYLKRRRTSILVLGFLQQQRNL